MSNVNEKLQALKVKEQEAIDYCNTKLLAKGVTEQATSVVDIGNKIESIQSEDTGIGSRQWWFDVCKKKTSFAYMFADLQLETIPPIDTSNSTNFDFIFNNCKQLITIPPIDTSKGRSFNYFCGSCYNLISVPTLDVSQTGTSGTFNNAFSYCRELQEISFVKESIHRTISFWASSKLTDESIQSIIDGLADLTGQTAQKLSFHSVVTNKITEEQYEQIANKNWILG